jgi:hypothetical protein
MAVGAAFTSTSLHKDIAADFTKKTSKCYIYKFTIPKGTKVLPLLSITRYFAELEILLPHGKVFDVRRDK